MCETLLRKALSLVTCFLFTPFLISASSCIPTSFFSQESIRLFSISWYLHTGHPQLSVSSCWYLLHLWKQLWPLCAWIPHWNFFLTHKRWVINALCYPKYYLQWLYPQFRTYKLQVVHVQKLSSLRFAHPQIITLQVNVACRLWALQAETQYSMVHTGPSTSKRTRWLHSLNKNNCFNIAQ